MRLIRELSLDEVDFYHYLDCKHSLACLTWVDAQRSPRWKAYTCRYCWQWVTKPIIKV